MIWHTKTTEEVFRELRSSPEGLTGGEGQERLGRYGPNELKEKKQKGPAHIFFDQFKDFMILVLIAAAVVAGVFGDVTDIVAIVVIVILNAIIGFVQEFRAERSMAALREMAAQAATVLRDGKAVRVNAAEVVPGDVVLLEAGVVLPADLRLTETAQLKIEEAALTGESEAVEKRTNVLHEESMPLGDRRNMAYRGTTVTYGRGAGVVVGTGMQTEIGRIASMLQEEEKIKTPLQRRFAEFGRRLSAGVMGICVLLFVVGILRGEQPLLMFMTALSLVVAAIPEAMPAVITISLSLAAKTMVRRNALIRKLPAVETLGSVTFVCSDKTGTLTLNRMSVDALWFDGRLSAAGESRVGPVEELVLRALALSNDVVKDPLDGGVGDPTEVALFAAANGRGFDKAALEQIYPRVAEIPFDSERKCMTTVHAWNGSYLAITKGAADVLIDWTTRVRTSSGEGPVDREEIRAASDAMAEQGMRVLAFGVRSFDLVPDVQSPEEVESDLTFLCLVGLIDPPREEAKEAVARCKQAGITPVMITGDHPVTATVIARRVGILDGEEVLTGKELEALSPREFERRVCDVRVYARVAPEQKLRIVKALQAQGELVAMTGDGVNDAPALKKADIGVAMGITGTDVSKQVADMVLLDDNFATIVRAVEEGRKIFDGIMKMARYILSTNAGEIMLIFFTPLFGLPLPLLPIHMLWLNLVTDGLPSLAFATGPAEPDVMRRPPRDPKAGILTGRMAVKVLWTGFLLAASGIILQALTVNGATAGKWRTILFSFMCFAELGAALALTSETRSFFTVGLGKIRVMLLAVAATFGLQLCVIYVPALQAVFDTQPLSWVELVLTLAVSSVLFVAVELEKVVRRLRPHAA